MLKFNLIIGSLFIVGGGLLASPALLDDIVTAQAPMVEASQQPVVTRTGQAASTNGSMILSGFPSTLTVDDTGIDLGVRAGYYDARTTNWTLDNSHAFYATITPLPNDSTGTTFMYGHNRVGVFSTLKNVTKDSKAVVKTTNGRTFTYSYERMFKVTPENSQAVLAQSEKPTLVLQTCGGILDQYRMIYIFNFEEAS